VVHALVVRAQQAGALKPIAAPQALAMLASSTAMPILFGGAAVEGGHLGKEGSAALASALLTDAAIDERVDLVLSALAAPPAPRKPTPRKPTPKKNARKKARP
jgi:hypothetical protein